MNIMIHACHRRMWYVEQYLLPDIQNQTDAGIYVWNDENDDGCLKAFIKSCIYITENEPERGGIWHLQDDVMVSDSFGERISEYEKEDIIINGFVGDSDGQINPDSIGRQLVDNHWFSFPCIYIPNRYIYGFLDWFEEKCIRKGLYANRVAANKYDDFLFWRYMMERNSADFVYNAFPNLAEHVDYLIGGSSVSNERRNWARSRYFYEDDKVESLKKTLIGGD